MAGIFRAYDIRGRYPDELDEATARRIGNAFVGLLAAERIVVGRDMRLSSPSLARAFSRGAVEAGAEVADIGMASTPLLNYAVTAGGFDGGAMVTASHLPGEMNGFKLDRENAVPLSGDRDLPLLETRVGEEPVARAGGSCRRLEMLDAYIGKVAGFVRNPRPLTIVVDAGNGMAGPEVPRLFERVPAWGLVPMYLEPDGRFPHHHANPLDPATTRELQDRVVAEGAEFGVAFDGDGDRCGFVDERGRRVREDLVTGLIAAFLLEENPGAAILYDLRSSRAVVEVIGEAGGRPVRSRVGHAFIKALMREEDALFAGELSGHYYYREMGFVDNGLLTMVLVANLIAASGRSLSELVRPLDRYSSTGEINLRVSDPAAVLAVLAALYRDADLDRLDGLTAGYPDWWFNIRRSHTEPVVRLNLEAETKELMDEKVREVLAAIRKADPAAREA
ncbi:phosphomannomutase/phosphoglucomutase [Methanoculleus sp. Wushi-C6]|uniref:Phosphomannomutase/phosphoglucomutase n=1 Tax=Methanoculleus caldifontis TaxID=2651577 RepID=A0ABU3WZC6_9EURY|nr:phosphomannomutase/phosphoglucomutase [Methanoculleus sp. Wushi-C6]MDV2481155.1 phosphomannomutase/phosphoglucomutase [Methanoculleus sp. Wushi-C6]